MDRQSELELQLARLEAHIHELHALCEYVATADRRHLSDTLHDRCLVPLSEAHSLVTTLGQNKVLGIDEDETMLSRAGDLIAETIDTVRNLLAEIDPSHLDEVEDIAESLRTYAEDALSDIRVVVVDQLACMLTDRVRLALHRILVSTLKYLVAPVVRGAVVVRISDDTTHVRATVTAEVTRPPDERAGILSSPDLAVLRRLIDARATLIGGGVRVTRDGDTWTMEVSVPRGIATGTERLLTLPF